MRNLILVAIAAFSLNAFAQDSYSTATGTKTVTDSAVPAVKGTKTPKVLPTVAAPVCCKGKVAADDAMCAGMFINSAEAQGCAEHPKCKWIPGCGGVTPTVPACCTGTGSDGISCNSLTAQGQTRCEAMKCTWQNPCQN